MIPTQKIYSCKICGAKYPKWLGQCVKCGSWNSIQEEFVKKSPKNDLIKSEGVVNKINEIESLENERIKFNDNESYKGVQDDFDILTTNFYINFNLASIIKSLKIFFQSVLCIVIVLLTKPKLILYTYKFPRILFIIDIIKTIQIKNNIKN